MIRQKFIEYCLLDGVSAQTATLYANTIGGYIRAGVDPLDVPSHLRYKSGSSSTALNRFKQFALTSDIPHLHIRDQWTTRNVQPASNLLGFRDYLEKSGLSLTTALLYVSWVNRILRAVDNGESVTAAIQDCKSGIRLAQTAWKHYQTFLNPPPPKPDFSKVLDVLPELSKSGWLEPLAAGACWQDIVTVHGLPGLRWKGTAYCLTSDAPLRRLREWGCPDAPGCLILPASPRTWTIPKLEDLREAVKQARAASPQPREHGSSTLPAFPGPPPSPDIGPEKRTPSRGLPADVGGIIPEVVFELASWTAEINGMLNTLPGDEP